MKRGAKIVGRFILATLSVALFAFAAFLLLLGALTLIAAWLAWPYDVPPVKAETIEQGTDLARAIAEAAIVERVRPTIGGLN